jgi:hypothetical protein
MFKVVRPTEELVFSRGALSVAFVLAAVGGVARADGVKVHNELDDCAAIKVDAVSTNANLVTARVNVTVFKPIGECRCLSALAGYSATVDRGGARQVLQTGLVSLMTSGEKILTLATEPSLLAHKEVLLSVGCTGPL